MCEDVLERLHTFVGSSTQVFVVASSKRSSGSVWTIMKCAVHFDSGLVTLSEETSTGSRTAMPPGRSPARNNCEQVVLPLCQWCGSLRISRTSLHLFDPICKRLLLFHPSSWWEPMVHGDKCMKNKEPMFKLHDQNSRAESNELRAWGSLGRGEWCDRVNIH